jgi:hypothetical protein
MILPGIFLSGTERTAAIDGEGGPALQASKEENPVGTLTRTSHWHLPVTSIAAADVDGSRLVRLDAGPAHGGGWRRATTIVTRCSARVYGSYARLS